MERKKKDGWVYVFLWDEPFTLDHRQY